MRTLLNTRGLLPLTTYADGRCELWWHPKLDRVYLDTHRGEVRWWTHVSSQDRSTTGLTCPWRVSA